MDVGEEGGDAIMSEWIFGRLLYDMGYSKRATSDIAGILELVLT